MRLTPKFIFDKKKKGEKIVSLTAYDYPFGRILDESEIDIILVGDSLGMVLLGYETTLSVTMEEMIHHTKAVSRAVEKALLVGDMPYHSYDDSEKALINAKRFIEEGGADAVKLEGGEKIQKQIEAVLQAKIPVMGHLGMLPQSVKELGGYHVQGKDPAQAEQILKAAQLLDRLGVFAIVLECVPAKLADQITRKVKCPTIGIGAGPKTDGQILVLHDMLGFHGRVRPRFVRPYASLEKEAKQAVSQYRSDVLSGKFPSEKESF